MITRYILIAILIVLVPTLLISQEKEGEEEEENPHTGMGVLFLFLSFLLLRDEERRDEHDENGYQDISSNHIRPSYDRCYRTLPRDSSRTPSGWPAPRSRESS